MRGHRVKRPDEETPAPVVGQGDAVHDPYQALRFRDFRLLMIGVFVGSFGQQMLSVALGWELYNRTGRR